MANPQAFFSSSTVQGIARTVSASTQIPVSVILAQMADETAYGTSGVWLQCRNPAGINGSGCGGFQSYPSYTAAAQGYAATYHNGYYAHVLAVAASGASPDQVAIALGQSPWASSHYYGYGQDGGILLNIMQTYNLTQYDHAASPQPSPHPNPIRQQPAVLIPVIFITLGLLGVGTDLAWIRDQRTGRWFWQKRR